LSGVLAAYSTAKPHTPQSAYPPVCAVKYPGVFAAVGFQTENHVIVNTRYRAADCAPVSMPTRAWTDDIGLEIRHGGCRRGDRHSASQDLTVERWRYAPNRAFAQPVHSLTKTGQNPALALIGFVCRWTPVPDSFTARVATARSLSVVTATAVTSIARTAVLSWRDLPRCAERPNATVQRAVAGTVMRSDSDGSGRVNEKK